MLPRYEAGGWVDRTGPAIVHKGELVVPADRARGGVSLGGIVLNVTPSASPEEVAQMAYRHVLRAARESKAFRDAVGAGLRGSLHS